MRFLEENLIPLANKAINEGTTILISCPTDGVKDFCFVRSIETLTEKKIEHSICGKDSILFPGGGQLVFRNLSSGRNLQGLLPDPDSIERDEFAKSRMN